MTIERLLVSKKDLRALGIPYSFAHIARLEAAGRFPKRIRLGQCRVAWLYEDVVNWVQDRLRGGRGDADVSF
jgi:prophage regulatory protein